MKLLAIWLIFHFDAQLTRSYGYESDLSEFVSGSRKKAAQFVETYHDPWPYTRKVFAHYAKEEHQISSEIYSKKKGAHMFELATHRDLKGIE